MSPAPAAISEARPTLVDLAHVAKLESFDRIVDALGTSRRVTVGGLWGSSQALALATLTQRLPGPWLAIASSDSEAQLFAEDLSTFGVSSTWLPARGEERDAGADLDLVRLRLQVVQQLAGPPERRPRMLVASLLALLQPLPARTELERDFLSLARNQKFDAEELLERLVHSGYTRQPLAEKPGEVSLRGEILDIYPFASELPLRIEVFDDAIESLRTFDPLDQRSVHTADTIQVCIASDAGGIEDGEGVLATSFLAPTAVVVAVEPLRIDDRAEGLRIRSPSHQRALMQLGTATGERRRLELQSLPSGKLDIDTRSVQALSVGIKDSPSALRDVTVDGTRAVVLCHNAAEAHRFNEILAGAGGIERVETRVGSLTKGFRLPAQQLIFVNHRELAGTLGRRALAKTQPAHRVRAIQSFFDLKTGDLVVHAVHGLARFTGLKRMERSGGEEEHLHLMFADEVSLYVPGSRIDHVQRYVGTGTAAPALDKIGSQSFRKRKEKVERALMDLAAELLEVQARRSLKSRAPWAPDPAMLADMIGSFMHTDTSDQVVVDREIATDLGSERPMDRLLCGDVGFGKTELAVRAAFRVVSGGGQVAVLVPTTVLAQQHYETFRDRLADFPVEIAMLSRYVTGAQAQDALTRVADGQIDILIGTHRVLSNDVQFKRLGLTIVDEEQRFGVTHKEHFKKMRANVDVLTLTATPIPRTLHMSLSGVRDISALAVPPAGRQEIDTKLAYCEDDDLIREALRREKNRNGQVFFLHNRVDSIMACARRLQELVPECSYAIGHGQMNARELRNVMESVTRGDIDVLVATTIIESGIDIPAAGTIVIDRADHFGLSELHQLRGRVGRGPNKAHCYLLVERGKPLRQDARERLKALEEMTQLGSGFAISMKDLEIRGAGNILGPEQSGHIGAVGYDMYCRFLKQTLDRRPAPGAGAPAGEREALEESGVDIELGLRAFLPEDWIPEAKTRLELLRTLSAIQSDADADRNLATMRDRFGRVPPEALSLLRSFRLKTALERMRVTRLSWRAGFYLIEFDDRVALESGLELRRADVRLLRTGVAHLAIPPRNARPEQALDWFESLLKHTDERPTIAAEKSR